MFIAHLYHHAGGGSFVPNEEGVMIIMSMGFTRDQAVKALKSTDNSIDRAADWIFSHADELDTPMDTDPAPSSEAACKDGSGSKFIWKSLAVIHSLHSLVI